MKQNNELDAKAWFTTLVLALVTIMILGVAIAIS